MTALKVSGPTQLSPEGTGASTGQFTATGTLSDGSTADETAHVVWGTSDSRVVSPTTTPGQMRAGARGEAWVTAKLNNKTAQFPMFVSEPGTYRIAGFVTETETGLGLSNVDIEVVSGAGAGLATRTTGGGHYVLFGVGGAVVLRASADGFGPQVAPVTVTDYTTTNFVLSTLSSPVDISGSWTIALSASPACRNTLPALARDRQYDATIAQQGERVTITLVNPSIGSFSSDLNGRFESTGFIFANRLDFHIPGDTGMGDWSTTDFYERLGPSLSLGLSVAAHVPITGSENAGTLTGDIESWNSPTPGPDRPAAVCRAQDHTVVLRRR